MTIFRENGKKILGQPTKNYFKLKMLKLLENHVKTKV